MGWSGRVNGVVLHMLGGGREARTRAAGGREDGEREASGDVVGVGQSHAVSIRSVAEMSPTGRLTDVGR